MHIENVAIVGMGALGMLYGDMLTRALGRERVHFIADAARRARYADMTFTVNGEPRDFSLTDPDTDAPADLVLFATKATALDCAIEDAAAHVGENTILLSVLNGITSERILEARFGKQNVVYCVAQGMDAVKLDGALTYSRPGVLCVGVPEPSRAPALEAVCELLTRTGVPYQRDPDVMHRLWSKFMLNVGVNQVVMACEGTYGTIQQPGPQRERMIAAMREVIPLAACEGVPISEDDLWFYVNLVGTLSPEGMPSMRQDGLARRKSEVELFSGTVCRLAKKHKLPCPVNEALYAEITAREATY